MREGTAVTDFMRFRQMYMTPGRSVAALLSVRWLTRTTGELSIGLGGLCWHNFEHNRYKKHSAFYAGIIGTFEHNVCERGRLVLVDSRLRL